CGPASSLISPKRTTFPATPGAPSRPKHRPTRLAQRRGMALPKTGPSETWMSTTRPHGRVHAVSRLGQGHSAAPRSQAGGSRVLLQFAGVELDALADADRVGRRLEAVAAGQVARGALVLARDGAERVATRHAMHARALPGRCHGARHRRALVVDHRQRRVA